MTTPIYTYATICTACGGWLELGGNADDEAQAERECAEHRVDGETQLRMTVDRARALPRCECRDTTPPAPRRPVAGWAEEVRGKRFDLGQHGSTGLPRATAYREANSDWWAWHLPGEAHLGHQRASSAETAQLAAEDALRAVLVDAAAALGLRVVPS